MIVKVENGVAFLDLLLSLVLLSFIAIGVYSEGKMLSVLNAGRENFGDKLNDFDWTVEELLQECKLKKYTDYKKALCCKKEVKECAVFIVQEI